VRLMWFQWTGAILAAAGYQLAYFDGINDFWVREESAGRLLPEFAVPVNVLDGFTQPDPRVKALEAEHARAADAARFHAESAVTAMALLVAAKVETEAALRTALAAARSLCDAEGDRTRGSRGFCGAEDGPRLRPPRPVRFGRPRPVPSTRLDYFG
jgi:hypothetical protein